MLENNGSHFVTAQRGERLFSFSHGMLYSLIMSELFYSNGIHKLHVIGT